MNEEKVLEALKKSGAPMKSVEIAEATGLPKADVDKAIKNLVKEGRAESPKRCFYAAK
ncbi:helix-turn-helix domain-containing protein [uncultured Rikenella sp.]|uniref:helix-turn-helix transcriptional regulator n=1 Tax=uncultured Rikenella sp. TaxID=368003 RepID=UPI00260F527D|nr:helix-turn-helix domain-containing protein [uncultured Rikenella sp.]